VAYTMVAERDNQKVKKERASALIVLANARVWESEGWQVMITDPEGKEFDAAGLEKVLGPGYAWSPQEPLSLVPQVPSPEEQEFSLSPHEEEPAEEAEQAAGPSLESEAFAEADPFDDPEPFEEPESFEELEALALEDEELGALEEPLRAHQ
jgi:hypothetical protein